VENFLDDYSCLTRGMGGKDKLDASTHHGADLGGVRRHVKRRNTPEGFCPLKINIC